MIAIPRCHSTETMVRFGQIIQEYGISLTILTHPTMVWLYLPMVLQKQMPLEYLVMPLNLKTIPMTIYPCPTTPPPQETVHELLKHG